MHLFSTAKERNLIACLIKSRDAYLRITDFLTVEDFSHELNQALFTSIVAMHDKRLTIDPVSLAEYLTTDQVNQLDDIGGFSYLMALEELPIAIENVLEIAQQLREFTLRRRTKTAGENVAILATSEAEVAKMLSKAQVEIDNVSAGQDEGVVLIGEGLQLHVQHKIEHPQLLPGLPSGFTDLDRVLQGWQNGELYVLGARKKTGKSLTLLTWARHLAVVNQIPILWITTEHQLKLDQMRLLSMVSEVPFSTLNNGMVKDVPTHMQRVIKAISDIEVSPLYFKFLPEVSLDKLRRIVRKHVRLDGVKAVFYDYIKPPSITSASRAEWQELGVFSYGLKQLANEEDVPFVTAVQLNREAAAAQKMQADVDSDYFAGSDRIAQALTCGMVLRRPFKNELEGLSYTDEVARVLEVTDNRLGMSGYKGLLQFEASILTLRELQRLN